MSQFTRGPFLVSQNEDQGIYLATQDGSLILCKFVHSLEDARLLARASELLALVKGFVEDLVERINGEYGTGDYGPESNRFPGEQHDLVITSRALILEIEGDK